MIRFQIYEMIFLSHISVTSKDIAHYKLIQPTGFVEGVSYNICCWHDMMGKFDDLAPYNKFLTEHEKFVRQKQISKHDTVSFIQMVI